MKHEHDPELTECRNCGSRFDLARQHYYDDLCPSCKRDDDPYTAWPRCVACETRAPAEQMETARVRTRYGPRETVLVCSEGCTEHTERETAAPHAPSIDRGEKPYYDRDVARVNAEHGHERPLEVTDNECE